MVAQLAGQGCLLGGSLTSLEASVPHPVGFFRGSNLAAGFPRGGDVKDVEAVVF